MVRKVSRRFAEQGTKAGLVKAHGELELPVVSSRRIGRLMGICLAALAVVCPPLAAAQDSSTLGKGIINTYAGVQADSGTSSTVSGKVADTPIGTSNAVLVDSNGNLYVAAGGGYFIYVVYKGGSVPILTAAISPQQPQQGNVYPVAGLGYASNQTPCGTAGAPDDCGDGGSALNARFGSITQMALDPSGNLYIADSIANAIRKIDTQGTITTFAGDPTHVNFGYSPDGTSLGSAILWNPNGIAIDAAGNILFSDSTNSLVRKIDTQLNLTTIAGSNQVYCSTAPCGDGTSSTPAKAKDALFAYPEGLALASNGDLYIADAQAHEIRKIDTNGNITDAAGTSLTPCGSVNSQTVADCGADNTAATSALLNTPQSVLVDAAGNILIADTLDNTVRLVDTSGNIHSLVGTVSANSTYSGDGSQALDAGLSNPYGLALDTAGNLYIADNENAVVRQVLAPSALTAQTITFPALQDVAYGVTDQVELDATASSGLQVAYTVTGPAMLNGSSLTLTGAGTVSVTASQPGDNVTYAPATPVTRSFEVNKGVLTVTADDKSRDFGAANPTLTYKITGFAPRDSVAVVTGAPVLSTTASLNSPVGQYPISVAAGSLSAANYTFKLVNGTLTVTGGLAQTITFGALPNVTYGAPVIQLAATASSGLPVTYTVTGPAQSVASTVVVTGVGTVSVTATQLGNSTYGAATPVTQSFNVAPAVLTLTANNAQRQYNQPNPAFTYSVTGFVSADTMAVISGAPVLTTTATQSSPLGQYPITISQGTLFAQNYTFKTVNGTLTVGLASQTITFPTPADVTYFQTTNFVLNATASSGLPVQYTATGPITVTSAGVVTVLGVGPVTVTATQPGNSLYQAAPPVTVSFVVNKGTLQVNAVSVSRPFGADNPVFTYQLSAGVNAVPANSYTGIPLETTAATAQSPTGTYPIVITQGTLTSSQFNFNFVNGTLTVTPPSTYILTANPSSVTIPRGQSRQVTITMTPINGYAGSVTIGCNGLPAGVTCTSSPAALTPAPATGNGQTNPVQGTLTISAGATVASAQSGKAEDSTIRAAGILLLPAGAAGLLVCLRRRKLARRWQVPGLMLALMLIAAGCVSGCGGGSSKSGSVQTGTTEIMVTGTASSSPGTGDLNQSLALTVTIE